MKYIIVLIFVATGAWAFTPTLDAAKNVETDNYQWEVLDDIEYDSNTNVNSRHLAGGSGGSYTASTTTTDSPIFEASNDVEDDLEEAIRLDTAPWIIVYIALVFVLAALLIKACPVRRIRYQSVLIF